MRKMWIGLLMVALVVTACTGDSASEPEPTPDLVATEVAVQRAAAATLTSEAPPPPATLTPSPTSSSTPAAQSQSDIVALPSPTPTPTSTPTPTETATPVPTGTTAPTPTATSTVTPPPPTSTNTPVPPTPTATRPIFEVLPVDGNDGNASIRGSESLNDGRYVVIPGVPRGGINQSPPVFREWLTFQVEPFDPAVGNRDGEGINRVNFTIVNRDRDDEQVYFRTEFNQAYCAFSGGEPDCNVFVFSHNGFRWPDGPPLENANYRAVIEIVPDHGQPAIWNWDFVIDDVPYTEPVEGNIVADVVQLGEGSLDPVLTTDLVFQVQAYHTGYGSNDGDGIDFVEMSIRNEQGQLVHQRVEQNAGYCAFGGGEPDCNTLSLDRIDPGEYTLQAVVHAETGQTQSVEAVIEVE